jgi:16S rRNA (guanine1207-N2)-methyltransferase
VEPALPPDQYFSGTPTSTSRRRQVELVVADLTATLVTDAGVFSPDRIDPGTRLLLQAAPAPAVPPQVAVDLGCGYGPIARVLAHRFPACRVIAVEVNERARALAAENLASLPNVAVVAPDDITADLPVDLLWSNPPIRIGKAALHALLLEWLGRLTPTGEAVLVVQKHLGADSLARWIAGEGWVVERLLSRQSYRLLRVCRSAAPS